MNDDDDDEVGQENPASGVIHQNRVTTVCCFSCCSLCPSGRSMEHLIFQKKEPGGDEGKIKMEW